MNKEENMTPSKEYNNNSIVNCEDEKTDEMPEKEFRRIIEILLKNTEKQLLGLNKFCLTWVRNSARQ